MTVNSTSSTATMPMTVFARRDNVGTGTGGRMATSGLLTDLEWPGGPHSAPTGGPGSASPTVAGGGGFPGPKHTTRAAVHAAELPRSQPDRDPRTRGQQ